MRLPELAVDKVDRRTRADVAGFGSWVKTSAVAEPSAVALPSDGVDVYKVITIYNASSNLVFINFGTSGVSAVDETGSSGVGLVIAGGVYVDVRLDDGDTHFIASAGSSSDIYVMGRE